MPNKNKQINATGDTALHFAVRSGQVVAVKILLKLGTSPRAKNKQGETVLQLAEELRAQHSRNKEKVDILDCWVDSYALLEKHIQSSKAILRKLKAVNISATKYQEI